MTSELTSPPREVERRPGVARVTERDRNLVGVLALARYLSTGQVARVAFPGVAEKTVLRRLLRLSGESQARSLARPVLRRRWHLTESGRHAVWALTEAGYVLASQVLDEEVRVPAKELGDELLDHQLALNELLVALLPARPGLPARPRRLPFRWLMSGEAQLPWRQYVRAELRERERLLAPDAILELPAARRRLFIEAEMGTHSIAGGNPDKPGATLEKLKRYDGYLTEFADRKARPTFYERRFPDAWPACLLFAVRTASRRESVRAAIARHPRTAGASPALAIEVLTFEEAGAYLRKLVHGESPAAVPAEAAVPLCAGELEALRAFYSEVYEYARTATQLLGPAGKSGLPALASAPRVKELLAQKRSALGTGQRVGTGEAAS